MTLVHSIVEEDLFRLCFYPGWLGWGLAYFELSPMILVVVMWGVSLFYGMDWALFLLYNVGVSVVWWISWMLNAGLRGSWSPEYADCNLGPHSLPDVYYVTSGTFLLTLGLVGLTRRTKFRVMTSVIFLAVFGLYTASLAWNRYQPLSHFFFSLALVCWFTAFWFVVYVHWLIPLDDHYRPSRVTRWLGANDALSLRHVESERFSHKVAGRRR